MTRDTLVIRRVADAPNSTKLLDDPVWAARAAGSHSHPAGRQSRRHRRVAGRGARGARRQEDLLRLPLGGPVPLGAPRAADQERMTAGTSSRPIPTSTTSPTSTRTSSAVIFSTVRRVRRRRRLASRPQAARRPAGLAQRPRPALHRRPHGRHVAVEGVARRHVRRIDDQYIGPPRDPTPDEATKLARYQGGYWGDPGTRHTMSTISSPTAGGIHGGPVEICAAAEGLRRRSTKAMGTWNLDADASVDEGSKWWMFEQDTVPYSAKPMPRFRSARSFRRADHRQA